MPSHAVSEQQIVAALQQVPPNRWGEVLTFLQSLQSGKQPPAAAKPILTGTDLLNSDLIGIWADRTDIGDSREFARKLRRQAEQQGKSDVAGQ